MTKTVNDVESLYNAKLTVPRLRKFFEETEANVSKSHRLVAVGDDFDDRSMNTRYDEMDGFNAFVLQAQETNIIMKYIF